MVERSFFSASLIYWNFLSFYVNVFIRPSEVNVAHISNSIYFVNILPCLRGFWPKLTAEFFKTDIAHA